jgi:hypothetical protein
MNETLKMGFNEFDLRYMRALIELFRCDGRLVAAEGGCELWKGMMTGGIPVQRFPDSKNRGRALAVYRMVYAIEHKDLPSEFVLTRSCKDIRCCVLAHIVPGKVGGEKTTGLTLNPDLVRKIRYMRIEQEMSHQDIIASLAGEVTLKPSLISKVVRRQIWKHVT